MPPIHQISTFNQLLAHLTEGDFGLLSKHLERVELPQRHPLSTPGQISDFCYFIETGIGSIVLELESGGKRAEIGIVGREGMVPTALILNAPSAPYATFMQVPGSGVRIRSTVLSHAMSESFTLQNLLTRYAQTMAVQTAFTALVNATHNIERRMARWILMCHDRVDDDAIFLTHEFLATMLAVRRQSVTTTLPILEGKRLIRASRNRITILDRAGLVEFAGTAYGSPETEYQRLMGF